MCSRIYFFSNFLFQKLLILLNLILVLEIIRFTISMAYYIIDGVYRQTEFLYGFKQEVSYPWECSFHIEGAEIIGDFEFEVRGPPVGHDKERISDDIYDIEYEYSPELKSDILALFKMKTEVLPSLDHDDIMKYYDEVREEVHRIIKKILQSA